MLLLIIASVLFATVIFFSNPKLIEGYRDPIYLNRAKYAYDIYPRTNGSIYGFPYSEGIGSWNIFSGWPYYDRAY